MADPAGTNANAGTPNVVDPTNTGTPPSNVPPKSVETPPEAMHKITVDGKEEELPLSKVIEFAQQGRHYAQSMGEMNQTITTKADEIANQKIDTWWAEVKAEQDRLAAEKDNAAYGELSDEEKLAKDIEGLKKDAEERKQSDKDATFEKEVANEQAEIGKALTEAKGQYPLMDEDKILAILGASEKFDIKDVLALAKRSHEAELKRRSDWERDYLKEGEARNKRGAEGAGGGVPPPPGTKLQLGKNTRQAVVELLNQRSQ